MPASELTFPLVARRRLIGLSFGAMHSARRGVGSDVAGSRPYRPGDDVHRIDWNASARLSLARAQDEFVVRERFAEEAPRVVVVCDRRPEMSFFSPPLPWLSKPRALDRAAALISDSAVAARSFIGYLDYADAEPFWRPPRSQRRLYQLERRHRFNAPPDNLERAFEHLRQLRGALPAGSFVFVLSDFLRSPPEEVWIDALERRWDVVPVVIQDPVWEQSFPDISGVVVPFVDPATGRTSHVRLTRSEAVERREANERRRDGILGGFSRVGLDPVVVSSSDREQVLREFLAWAERRLNWRGRAW